MGISTGDELQLLLTMRKKFKNSEPACLKRKGGLLMKKLVALFLMLAMMMACVPAMALEADAVFLQPERCDGSGTRCF